MDTTQCTYCNKTFKKLRCRRNIFCSLPCYHKNMKGKSKRFTGISAGGWNKGQKFPEFSGVNHPLAENKNGNEYRNSPKHREWSRQVKNRDYWKCQISNDDCSGRVEAHHILGWKDHPELRYEIKNGITLCHFHHPRKRVEEERYATMFQELVAAKMQ